MRTPANIKKVEDLALGQEDKPRKPNEKLHDGLAYVWVQSSH